eukprot:gene13309-63727_t
MAGELTKEEWHYDGGRMVQHYGRGAAKGAAEQLWELRGHGDLERHLETAGHQDPLDSVEEWLAMKRRTTRPQKGGEEEEEEERGGRVEKRR